MQFNRIEFFNLTGVANSRGDENSRIVRTDARNVAHQACLRLPIANAGLRLPFGGQTIGKHFGVGLHQVANRNDSERLEFSGDDKFEKRGVCNAIRDAQVTAIAINRRTRRRRFIIDANAITVVVVVRGFPGG